MPRPRNRRRVCALPQAYYYKPRGIPLSVLQQVILTIDEIEAIRLTDLEGLYQTQAAEKMNISRQTLGRILETAHKKIADALINGKALLIKGGHYELDKTTNIPFQHGPATFGQGPGRHRHRGGR